YSSNVTARRRKIVLEPKSDERAELREAHDPVALGGEIKKATSAQKQNLLKALRKRLRYALGPNPTPAHRQKVAKDIEALKPSIPASLYEKYLCDLATGVACP